MFENVTITLSGPPSAILKLLNSAVHFSEAFPETGSAPTAKEQHYSAPNTGALVSLDPDQFAAFFEGMDPRYQEGVRLISEGDGTVSWKKMVQKGIHNPGHFKSRTSLRARKVLGLSKRVQFASYFSKVEKGAEAWYLRVTPTTLASMQAYFTKQAAANKLTDK